MDDPYADAGPKQEVEKEALALAVLLEHGAATFHPAKAAPAWADAQGWWSGVGRLAGSAQASDPETTFLLWFARVLLISTTSSML